jgi:hypothetical protein
MRSVPLPDNATLQDCLADALGCSAVRVIARRPNRHSSTFPSEIAKLELADRGKLHAFIKYESGRSNGSHGHRVACPTRPASTGRCWTLGDTVPDLCGSHVDGQEAPAWRRAQNPESSWRLDAVRSLSAELGFLRVEGRG